MSLFDINDLGLHYSYTQSNTFALSSARHFLCAGHHPVLKSGLTFLTWIRNTSAEQYPFTCHICALFAGPFGDIVSIHFDAIDPDLHSSARPTAKLALWALFDLVQSTSARLLLVLLCV